MNGWCNPTAPWPYKIVKADDPDRPQLGAPRKIPTASEPNGSGFTHEIAIPMVLIRITTKIGDLGTGRKSVT